MARVLNLVFALANLFIAAVIGGPAVMAIMHGHFSIAAVWYMLLGVGLLVAIVAMVRPEKLTGVGIHILALGFLAPLDVGMLIVAQLLACLFSGDVLRAFFYLFFICSLAWGLWFVYQLVRIRKAQNSARRTFSR